MKLRIICLLCLTLPLAAAEFGFTAGNVLRAALGEETSNDSQIERNYFENIFSFDLSSHNLLLHNELGFYHPSEFPGNGLEDDRWLAGWLEYNGPLQLRLGTVEATFGRGLALSLYHDRNLETLLLSDPLIPYFDNRPLGGQLLWWGERINLNLLGGWSDYYGGLYGINLESPLSSHLQAGASLIYKPGDKLDRLSGDNRSQTISEYYTDLNLGDFSFGLNQAFQLVENPGETDSGDLYHITYLNTDFWWHNYTFALEYKYFNYYRNPFNQPDFMNPPIAMNEYTTHLISRHRRLVNYSDETGLMLEVRRSWGDSEYFINGAWASLTGNELNGDKWLLPNLNERYSAYQEYFGGATHYLSGQRILIWNAALVEEASHEGQWTRKLGVAAEYEQPLSTRFHGKLLVEWMREQDQRNDEGFNDWVAEASIYLSHTGHLTAKLDRSEDPEATTATNLWGFELVTELLDGRHKLILFYGDERGGLVCSSGSCRLVKPFSGVKLSLESWF